MVADAAKDETPGRTTCRGSPSNGSGIMDDAMALWAELRGLSHDRFRLAGLETRRAGESLVAMIVTGVMVAFLLNGAWLGLMAAGVLGLMEQGVVARDAILLAVAFNFSLALVLCGLIRRKSRHLRFPATLRSLRPTPTEGRKEEQA